MSARSPRRSLFVRQPDGRRQHYVETGSDGPTLLLLHGYADSWRSFEPLLGALGKDFRIVALDQRGHGASDPADAYAISHFADDVFDLVTRVIDGPVHIVGHSLGAIVAQRVAERWPAKVRSLTLLGGARTARGHALLRDFADELASLDDAVPRDLIESFQAGTVRIPLSPARLATLVADSGKLSLATWRGALDGLLTEPEPAARHAIHTPTLSLWGVDDPVFDKGAQATLARAIPEIETVHYAGVGHAPHWEVPDRVARDIRSFALAVEGHRKIVVERALQHA